MISVVDGTATVTGTGNAAGTDSNHGVLIDGAGSVIRATGTGGVSVTGTGGGSGAGATNHGVFVDNSGAISAVSNAVGITGTGGSGSTGGHKGIALTSNGAVTSTGASAITLTGTGGSGGAGNDDIYSLTGANVISGGSATGDIALVADILNLADLSVQTAGDIFLRPRSAGTTIGVAGGAGALDLSITVLGFLSAGSDVVIGRVNGTGAITANAYANWSTRAGAGVGFLSDTGVISINGAQTIGARNFTLTTNADPVIGSAITGTGALTLETASVGTTLGLAGGAGAVNYSAGDLTNLGSGWSGWNLGNTAHTGALTVAARAWSDPVTFRAAPAGSIVISGAQTAGVGSDTIFTFNGPAIINAALDLTNATAGTKDITFNDSAVVTASITSAGGDVDFGDTLSLGAAISTAGGDITLTNDVTLTANSSINTGTTDIAFGGTLDGTFDLALTTTGDVDFTDDVGAVTPLDNVTITGISGLTFGGDFRASGFTLSGTTIPVTLTSAIVISDDIDITTTGVVTFNDDLTYTGDLSVDAGGSAITFNGTVDSPGGLTLTTTGDITFAGNVGGVTPLGDVVIDPHDFIAGGSFNAESFTLTNGTGLVDFSAGTGLTATGNISIATNGNILGTFTGANGILDAGAGTITATVSFATLDIDGAAATLGAGYIGAPGPVTQTMANLISIGGQRHPWPAGIPNDNFIFAGLNIGGSSGSGGVDDGGSIPPVSPDPGPTLPPGTDPGPILPPGMDPHGPVISTPASGFDSLLFGISRILGSAEDSLPVILPSEPQCDAASAYTSCATVLPSQ